MAAANPDSIAAQAAVIAQAETDLRTLGQNLHTRRLDDEALKTRLAAIPPVQAKIAAALAVLTPRLGDIDARLAQLGPAPGPGQPPEDPDNAATRAKLVRFRGQVDSEIKQGKLLTVEAGQLSKSVADRLRENFAARLWTQSRSIADPTLWRDFAGATPTDLARLRNAPRLEARDPLHLSALAVQTAYDLATATARVSGSLSQNRDATLRLTLTRAGRTVAQRDIPIAGSSFEATLTIDAPDAWSPDAPNLYDLAIELVRDGRVCDRLERTIGFRRFEAKDGRLLLNGEPFTLLAALDQDWTEDANWPPNDSGISERFRNAKAMGLNALRCHVKIPNREYFDLADRLGLIAGSTCPTWVSSRRRPAKASPPSSGNPSPTTASIPRSASGRFSTRAGASNSTTTRTTAAG